MEKLRLVLADIDGTLTFESVPIDSYTRDIMEELHARGILLGLASGRVIDEHMLTYKDRWNLSFQFDCFIGMNGGQIEDMAEGQLYEFYKLEPGTIRYIIETMDRFQLNPFLYEGNTMIVHHMDDETRASMKRNGLKGRAVEAVSELWKEPAGKICMRVKEDRMPEVYAWAKEHERPDVQAFKTQTTMLEFMDPRVSKGFGLEKLAALMNIPLKEIWAFGDEQNDDEMLRKAGKGICLVSGGEGTKKAADTVTEYPVTQAGFAHYMEDHYLKQVR